MARNSASPMGLPPGPARPPPEEPERPREPARSAGCGRRGDGALRAQARTADRIHSPERPGAATDRPHPRRRSRQGLPRGSTGSEHRARQGAPGRPGRPASAPGAAGETLRPPARLRRTARGLAAEARTRRILNGGRGYSLSTFSLTSTRRPRRARALRIRWSTWAELNPMRSAASA